MNVQRFRLRNSGQVVYSIKGGPKYSEVLLPFDRETRKGLRGRIITVKTENLLEEKAGGYNYG